MLATKRFTYLLIALLISSLCLIKVSGDDSGEDGDETSSEEVYQFEMEDDVEEVTAEEFQPDDKDGSSLTNLDEDNSKGSPVGEKEPQTIEIAILPVTSDVFSCEGVPNGNQVDPNPTDCLSFYTCVEGTAYKIMCPQIPYITYYDPIDRTCSGNVDATFCLKHTGQVDPEPPVQISNTDSDLAEEEEEEDMRNFGGEINDEETSRKEEL